MAGFDAFISYSRRASTTLATDLQTAVERFAKPFYRLRAVRVFRDDASMSANTALWSTIEQGLKEAEWLVLLASPLAAQSQYVANELTWWREHKSADRIIIVLEEGVDIVWDRAANDFDFTVTDSIPRALSGAFAEEPRWIDLRWYEAAGSQGRDDPRWLERVADVAAAVRGAERDQLIGENVRQHKRAQLLLRGGVAALSLLLVASLVATIIAIGQRSEAQRQRNEAREQRDEAERQSQIALARQLAAQAVALAPTDLQTASLLAVQAFRTNDDAQTRAALFQMATASPQLVRTLPVGAHVTAAAVTPDGLVVTGDGSGRVQAWRDGEASDLAELQGMVTSVDVTDDGATVAAVSQAGVVLWRDGQAVTLTDVPAPITVRLDPEGRYLAASFDSQLATGLWALGGDGTTFLGTVDVGGEEMTFAQSLLVMLYASGQWAVAQLEPFEVVSRGTHPTDDTAVQALAADGLTMAAADRLTDYPVWRGDAAYTDGDPANAVAHVDFLVGKGVALSSDGSLLAAQTDGRLQVVPVQEPQAAAQPPTELGGTGEVSNENAGALSFGGDRFVVSASGDSAFLWDLDQIARFGTQLPGPGFTGRCEACPPRFSLSPDGARAVASSVRGSPAVVVELDSGTTRSLDEEGALEGVSWIDDQRLLAFSPDREAVVTIDASSGSAEPVAALQTGDSVAVTRADPSGNRATVLTERGEVYSVDLGTGDVEAESSALRDALSETADGTEWGIAPDLSTVFMAASGYDDAGLTRAVNRLHIGSGEIDFASTTAVGAGYDTESRLLVFEEQSVSLVADGGDVTPLAPVGVEVVPTPAISPDGGLIAAGGSRDGRVSLIDLARQGTRFGSFDVPQQNNRFALSAFTADGASLVTLIEPMEDAGLPDGAIRTLSLVPDDWIAAACAVGARDLTEEDWARYGVGPAPDDLRCVQ